MLEREGQRVHGVQSEILHRAHKLVDAAGVRGGDLVL